MTYGNSGGAAAGGVCISDILPAGLSFVRADPAPISTTLPLRWEVGELAAQSGPFSIILTVTVAPTVSLSDQLANAASIGTIFPELETANNQAWLVTYIGYRVYLPLLTRGYVR